MNPTDLRVACARLNITYKEMGSRLGVGAQSVSNWCRGKSRIPVAVGLAVAYLMEKEESDA